MDKGEEVLVVPQENLLWVPMRAFIADISLNFYRDL